MIMNDHDLGDDDDTKPSGIYVMVMSCCNRCDVIRTSDDDAEYDGDYGRVRRCY